MELDKSYHHVYFRLNAGYKWGEGMSPDKTDKFFDEITKLFLKSGWTVKEVRRDYGNIPRVVLAEWKGDEA